MLYNTFASGPPQLDAAWFCGFLVIPVALCVATFKFHLWAEAAMNGLDKQTGKPWLPVVAMFFVFQAEGWFGLTGRATLVTSIVVVVCGAIGVVTLQIACVSTSHRTRVALWALTIVFASMVCDASRRILNLF
jgi:hypothetical protein